MKKIYNVDDAFNNMRIDRWIRKNFGNLPQGFIEKNLRNGKIKINNKKIKSSYKLNSNEKIEFFDFNYKINVIDLLIANDILNGYDHYDCSD